MSIVWILEKAKSPTEAAAGVLMGDFAVRVFASLGSFETVLKFDRQAQPDLLVIDVADIGASEARLTAFLAGHFVDIPVILLMPEGAAWTDSADVCVAFKPVDGLTLSMLADYLIRGRRGRRHVVRYRDLTLDLERLECVIMPGDEVVSLPLKEAQILKMLLGRPGTCLSRDEISATLWSGIKVTPRTIDSHVSRLRKRLKDAGVSIDSVYGGGYVLR